MKTITICAFAGALALALSGCGKSDEEKAREEAEKAAAKLNDVKNSLEVQAKDAAAKSKEAIEAGKEAVKTASKELKETGKEAVKDVKAEADKALEKLKSPVPPVPAAPPGTPPP